MNKNILVAPIQWAGEACEMKVSIRQRNWDEKPKRGTFISLDGPFNPEEMPDSKIKARPPYSIKGEDPMNDAAWKVYNKAELKLQKEAILLAVAKNLLDKSVLEDVKFSQRGYCACGCSPSWKTSFLGRSSVWITIVSPKKEAQKKAETAEYQSKREQEAPSFVI